MKAQDVIGSARKIFFSKTGCLVALCGLALFGLGGESSAQMAQHRHQLRLQLPGTCLDDGQSCNARSEWQYQLQTQEGCGPTNCGLDLAALDTSMTLTGDERQSLIYMREEEKLARDLYLAFYEQWGTPVFANIAVAEQQHMDTVWYLMQRYAIADSATETPGTFNNATLQALYDSQRTRGAVSQAEALYSGGFVEETDINDLQAALAVATNPAVTNVYGHLLNASEQHLRSFVKNLENLGFVYTSQLLDAERFIEILNGENEHGGYAVGGLGLQPSKTQFRAIVAAANGPYGNHASFSQQDNLHIGMLVFPERQHLGQPADFLMIALYFPQGAETASMFMRNHQFAWQLWNGDFATLVPAQARQQLSLQHRLTIHQGQLQTPGRLQVMVGYRLADGTLVMSGTPVEFTVR